ncbi:MAG: DUF4964 domain-containing protein [Singulisphaera sp.]
MRIGLPLGRIDASTIPPRRIRFPTRDIRPVRFRRRSAPARDLRPPSVPLVACDPYFSVWSGTDRLTDGATRHWTGKPHPLTSLIRIDDKAYRLMGPTPGAVPAMPQVGLKVLPTRTIYDFEGPEAHVTLTFLTPPPHDLDVLSRPVTYMTWDVRSRDGKDHAVSVYFDASGLLAANTPDQRSNSRARTSAG